MLQGEGMQAMRFGTMVLAVVALALRFAPVGCAIAAEPAPASTPSVSQGSRPG